MFINTLQSTTALAQAEPLVRPLAVCLFEYILTGQTLAEGAVKIGSVQRKGESIADMLVFIVYIFLLLCCDNTCFVYIYPFVAFVVCSSVSLLHQEYYHLYEILSIKERKNMNHIH